jgi:NAD(P)-dependent dehydrogenase (short-subunit alcohol dehydrogenase family)
MKHAFITGGARRVGREIALHLASLGYNITIHANQSKVEAEQTLIDIAALSVKTHIEYGDLRNVEKCSATAWRNYATCQ